MVEKKNVATLPCLNEFFFFFSFSVSHSHHIHGKKRKKIHFIDPKFFLMVSLLLFSKFRLNCGNFCVGCMLRWRREFSPKVSLRSPDAFSGKGKNKNGKWTPPSDFTKNVFRVLFQHFIQHILSIVDHRILSRQLCMNFLNTFRTLQQKTQKVLARRNFSPARTSRILDFFTTGWKIFLNEGSSRKSFLFGKIDR
jgi:hypothetical protein